MSNNSNKIGEAIKKYRVMKFMTARELASETGIAPSNLSAIESGDRVPKLDMCSKIAAALEADPIEICGIELTENDEKRLLMRLLAKYADDIEILSDTDEDNEADGVKSYNPEGKSAAILPIEFLDFALRYKEYISDLEFAVFGVEETDPRYELFKESAGDEFNYWMDMYPAFDAATIAKSRVEEKRKDGDSQKELDLDYVKQWSEFIQGELNHDFWHYQSDYIIPKRNEEWKAKKNGES